MLLSAEFFSIPTHRLARPTTITASKNRVSTRRNYRRSRYKYITWNSRFDLSRVRSLLRKYSCVLFYNIDIVICYHWYWIEKLLASFFRWIDKSYFFLDISGYKSISLILRLYLYWLYNWNYKLKGKTHRLICYLSYNYTAGAAQFIKSINTWIIQKSMRFGNF